MKRDYSHRNLAAVSIVSKNNMSDTCISVGVFQAFSNHAWNTWSFGVEGMSLSRLDF